MENLEKIIIKGRDTLETGIGVWGWERIVIDGFQNHLPGDSKGNDFYVKFLVNGDWVDFSRKEEINLNDVKAIMFGDDGKGYSYELLEERFSTKRGDESAAGEYGEGLGMITAACLREHIDLELMSRDWRAKPFVKNKIIEEDNLKIPVIYYEVEKNKPRIKGSKTIFKNFSREFSKYILDLDKKILALRINFEKKFETDVGSIIDESGELFAKGLFVTGSHKKDLMFGYDLITLPNRDRNTLKEAQIIENIGSILSGLDNIGVIKKIIEEAAKSKGYWEFRAMYEFSDKVSNQNQEIWKKAFYELFENNPILSAVEDSYNEEQKEKDKLATIFGYNVVKLDPLLIRVLKKFGVESAGSVNLDGEVRLFHGESYDPSKIKSEIAETSFTLDHGRVSKWKEKRIILDILQNHYDSGSFKKPKIEYLTTRWIGRNDKKEGDSIEAIRFIDCGKGFTPFFLTSIYSEKNEEDIGGIGEGMKMLCTAFLRSKLDNPFARSDMDLKFRSKDWVAMPFAADAEVEEGKTTKKLYFNIASGLEEIDGSITTIYQPSFKIKEVVEDIGKLVLTFNLSYSPLFYSLPEGTIFDGSRYSREYQIENNSVFVKDFFITDKHSSRLLFSYNFYDISIKDLNVDRDDIDINKLKESVKNMISVCDNTALIAHMILSASKIDEEDKFEFQTIEFNKKNENIAELYRNNFYSLFNEKLFGGNPVIASGNPYTYAEAKHRGFNPISFHSGMKQTLINAGVITDKEVVNEGFETEPVDISKLTEEERSVFDLWKDIDRILGFENTGNPLIYEKLFAKNGTELPYLGFFDKGKKQVYVKRDQLKSIGDFVETYNHEKIHEETRASDPEDEFRQAFEKRLAEYVVAELTGKPRITATVEQRKQNNKIIVDYKQRVIELELELKSYQRKLQELEKQESEQPKIPYVWRKLQELDELWNAMISPDIDEEKREANIDKYGREFDSYNQERNEIVKKIKILQNQKIAYTHSLLDALDPKKRADNVAEIRKLVECFFKPKFEDARGPYAN